VELCPRKADCIVSVSPKLLTYFIKESDFFTFLAVEKSRKNRFQRNVISFCYENDDYVGKRTE